MRHRVQSHFNWTLPPDLNFKTLRSAHTFMRIYVFGIDLRTNSDCLPIHHKPIDIITETEFVCGVVRVECSNVIHFQPSL